MVEMNLLGVTSFRDTRKKFGIKTDDRRRHIYVIGKTGMGKSTVLENMIVQDIIFGKGVGFIDPHGDTAEKILKFVPKNRINDVVYFNPADMDYPVAFNVFEKVDDNRKHLVTSGLIGVFKKIWAESWGPRLEYLLRNTILSLLDYPESTLLGVTRMLADKFYRKKIVEKIKDPILKAFWEDEFASYTDKFASEAIAPIQNKVGQFLSVPLIRNIVGQVRSSFNMREIMDKKKILIMDLSKGKIGEDNSAMLGAMLITKIYLSAMSRVDTPEDKRNDFYLYVDEFQNFATESFANILSEARKYHLCLTVANQYIAQLDEKVRDAIFGNIGTMVSFRVGAMDAEFMEKEFEPTFMQNDLVNLPKANYYIKLMIDGISSEPFSARGLPPLLKDLATNNLEKIIGVSRERYAYPRAVVEDKIKRWSEGTDDLKDKEKEEKEKKRKIKDGEVPMFPAECSNCKAQTAITFQPDGVRPVYCKNCLKLLSQGLIKPLAPKKIISPKLEVEKAPIMGKFIPKKEEIVEIKPEKKEEIKVEPEKIKIINQKIENNAKSEIKDKNLILLKEEKTVYKKPVWSESKTTVKKIENKKEQPVFKKNLLRQLEGQVTFTKKTVSLAEALAKGAGKMTSWQNKEENKENKEDNKIEKIDNKKEENK